MYGEASLPIEIQLIDNVKPHIRLENVLISNHMPYEIEIFGEVNNKSFRILPSAFEWTIDDSNICAINQEGVLQALANGSTMIRGILGEDTVQQNVVVQMVETSPLLWENMIAIDQRWEVKSSNNKWNTTFEVDDNGLSNLHMNFTGGRQANIRFGADTLLYSTPHTLEFRLTPPEKLIKKISFGLRANNKTTTDIVEITELKANEPQSISIRLDELLNTKNDIAIYPILLEFITFYLDTDATKKEYRMPIEGIYLHYTYPADDDKAVENISTLNTAKKILRNGQLIIIKNNKIYNILGHEISEKY
jgi:hypothetical protein